MTTYRGSGTTGSGSVLVTTASEITNAAAGDIEATNVQDAINELGDEKANITNPVFTGDATFGGASTQIGSNANPVVIILSVNTFMDVLLFENRPGSETADGYSIAQSFCLR